jgi:hypothetical protein
MPGGTTFRQFRRTRARPSSNDTIPSRRRIRPGMPPRSRRVDREMKAPSVFNSTWMFVPVRPPRYVPMYRFTGFARSSVNGIELTSLDSPLTVTLTVARFGLIDRGRPGKAARRRSRRRIATIRPVREEPIFRYRPDGPCPRWLARQVGQIRSRSGQSTDSVTRSSSVRRHGRPSLTPARRSKGAPPRRGRRDRSFRRSTGGGRSPWGSWDGGWRRSASTTPTESTTSLAP